MTYRSIPYDHIGPYTAPAGVTSVDAYACPGLTALYLPAGVKRVSVLGCPGLTPIYTDGRGYQLYAISGYYTAGCRSFHSAAAALAHWGGDKYPNKARGAKFCAAIHKHEAT